MNHDDHPNEMSEMHSSPDRSRPDKGALALSCAECRRSKLKCDRTIPCGSCIRRGCPSVCPDRTLNATKGNKVLMAHAQRLETEVKTMKSKIKELEAALANAKPATPSNSYGPASVLSSKSPQECEPNLSMHPNYAELDEVTTEMGSVSIGAEGQTKYHGSFAGSEYLSRLLMTEEEDASQLAQSADRYLGLMRQEIIELVLAAPYGIRDCKYHKDLFLPFIPSKRTALHLTDLYYKKASWMYNPVPRKDFDATIFSLIYDNEGNTSIDKTHPHRLSVFFIIIATGAFFDPDTSFLAQKYNALAAAALSLETILRNVTLYAIQSLLLMTRFSYVTDSSIDETRWLLFGACARAAQVIGLQRDSAPWHLDPQETQRRRILFFDVYAWDIWVSFINARPCIFRLEETDCCFPDDPGFLCPNGEIELSFHGWKFRFAATCLSQTVRYCMAHKTPNYSTFLELDRRIRTFPIPSHLMAPTDESGRGWSLDPAHAMQQYAVVVERESSLLYLHRSYLAKALREAPKNPIGHKYSPSVIAAYRSARKLISILRGLYLAHPELTSITWYFWSGVFSACYVLGGIVVESPNCSLAQPALTELERTIPFYNQGSAKCRIPATMHLLSKLLLRARTVFTAFQSGIETAPAYLADDPDLLDEEAVIGGRVSVLHKTKAASKSPESYTSPSPPISNAETYASYGNGPINMDELNPDVSMAFFIPDQFTARDHVADFSQPAQMAMDQMYSQYAQPMLGQQQSLPLMAPSFAPLDIPLQPQVPGANPNEVWDSFMQQLTREGYNTS